MSPLLPRFYSIASSKLKHPGELHLTVVTFNYPLGGRLVPGLASDFLRNEMNENDVIEFYHQANTSFSLPPDPKTPVIMIGPGTGATFF